ncbi:phosphodiester glycosidase family protein [soil metagenome]
MLNVGSIHLSQSVNRKRILILIAVLILAIVGTFVFAQKEKESDERFISYIVDSKKQDVKLYWKDDKQQNFKSILNLKLWLNQKHQQLLFAMNGGMYKQDNSPQGLFIENQRTVTPLDTSNGKGNFYSKPNGVFYITINNIPIICTTANFNDNGQIKYATQSGPMLVIDGQIHSAFKQGSTNLNIRNGVGILPGNEIVFAMSKKEIDLYDFANYFKSLGCKNALYLDGLVSRTYLPEKEWIQTDGNFGVIIGVTKRSN